MAGTGEKRFKAVVVRFVESNRKRFSQQSTRFTWIAALPRQMQLPYESLYALVEANCAGCMHQNLFEDGLSPVPRETRVNRLRSGSSWHPAGMTLVELLVVVVIVAWLVALLVPAVQAARESARRTTCLNNLRHIGCGLHGHLLAKRTFPMGCLEWKAGTGGTNRCLAWSALILPWLDEQTTADRVNYQKPFDDPANAVAAATAMQIFLCPSASRTSPLVGGLGASDYGGVVGERITSSNSPEKGVLVTGKSYAPREITDGLSKTILVAECAAEAWADGQWINGRNLFDQAYPINAKMSFWEDEMRSRHPNAAQCLAGDGSVHLLSETVDKIVLAAAFTRNRGESPAAAWVAP